MYTYMHTYIHRVRESHSDAADEEDMKTGILKKLSSEVPLLERALERDLKKQETEKRNVKDKHVVLMSALHETRQRSINMCITLRDKGTKRDTLMAMRSVAIFEQHHHASLTSLRSKVDARLARFAFSQFIQQTVMDNLLRRRGYLASLRHTRFLTLHFFSAWRWIHFSARWMPPTKSSPSKFMDSKVKLKQNPIALLHVPAPQVCVYVWILVYIKIRKEPLPQAYA